MTNSLITPEVKARLDRRLDFAKTDGNLMRANSQYTQYVQDVELLLAEIDDLNWVAQKAMEHND